MLEADLLQSVINEAHARGLLSLPIPHVGDDSFPIVQYADDTLLILPANAKELFCLKAILHTFSESTGLKMNYSKSCMVPINVAEEKMHLLASTFGCKIGSLPFTYLGLLLGTTKPRVIDFSPLVDRVERRLSSITSYLSYGGRLTMINSVLSSLPTYFMCTLKLPKKVIEHIDHARRHCLWRKSRENQGRCVSLASWEKVCKPKKKGGLGVIDLKLQNEALLMKHLHKFYNQHDLPWVKLIWQSYYINGEAPHAKRLCGSFWWRDTMRLVTFFRSISTGEVGIGSTLLFWKDLWNGEIKEESYPLLISFAKDQDISVYNFLLSPDLASNFHLPISQGALPEWHVLQTNIGQLQSQPGGNDIWSYVWSSANYQSKKVYAMHFGNILPPPPFSWIWTGRCLMKIKVLMWLLLADRLNTWEIMITRRFNIEGLPHCVLCPAAILETRLHLFFRCLFSQIYWNLLGIHWDLTAEFNQMLMQAKIAFQWAFFMDVVSIGLWHIWKQRNDRIFEGIIPSTQTWKVLFKKEIALHLHRVQGVQGVEIQLWLDSI